MLKKKKKKKKKLGNICLVFTSSSDVKFKNLFMLGVRISSYGCTREVWRARKMRKSSPSATLAS